MTGTKQRKPEWIRVKLSGGSAFKDVSHLVHSNQLHTVCESAKCPNMHECWGIHKTATFMILGSICTRCCRFCAVDTGLPEKPDSSEAKRVAESAAAMGLKHVVVTMVTRDDLKDGGASMIAKTVNELHQKLPQSSVEVLVSDLMADADSIKTVLESDPTINSHNLETVRRLTQKVRSRSDYDRSLRYLELVKEFNPAAITKSSLMLGLGETRDELLETFTDLRNVGVDIINLGQYLQPSASHIPVEKYWTPEEFAELKEAAFAAGFAHCESGPLVRSSYHAGEQYNIFLKNLIAGKQ